MLCEERGVGALSGWGGDAALHVAPDGQSVVQPGIYSIRPVPAIIWAPATAIVGQSVSFDAQTFYWPVGPGAKAKGVRLNIQKSI